MPRQSPTWPRLLPSLSAPVKTTEMARSPGRLTLRRDRFGKQLLKSGKFHRLDDMEVEPRFLRA
jgi:hypothetical protein